MVRPKQISDEEILETARACIMENGVGVAVQVIADRVGLSQPALFKRFGTKQALVMQALAPPERLPVLDWIESHPLEGPLLPQIEELLFKVWMTLKMLLPMIALIRTSSFDLETFFSRYETPPPVRLLRSIAEYLGRARENGQIRQDVDVAAAAQGLLGVLQGRVFFQFFIGIESNLDDDAYIRSVADIISRGLQMTEDER